MPRDRRKGKRWSYTAGHYPTSVRVYERERGGPVYMAVSVPGGGEKRKSLGRISREEAKKRARTEVTKLSQGMESTVAKRATAQRVFALYREHRTPDKESESSRREDDRQADLWTRFLGGSFDLTQLSRREWDTFVRKRRSGAIGPRGEPVPDMDQRRKVGNRSVQKDLVFLRAVIHWALGFRDDGYRLLTTDPTIGFKMPRERNPKRPVATHDRVDAIREHYRKPTMRLERAGKREHVESYLPEIFEIVVGTGRRISAVCSLRVEDIELDSTDHTPWGSIVWPSDTDKMGREWKCPISQRAREAIDQAQRKRKAVGPGWLFPRPGDSSKPTRYEEASVWLREAERLAELEPHDGSLWHAYRRLWASCRKDLPDVDVAQAGGWSSLEALKQAYQQPDNATLLRVVTHETELRQVRA